MKTQVKIVLLTLMWTNIFSQDFSTCKINLSVFVPQEKFHHLVDDGKEVVLIKENLPNYNKLLVQATVLNYFEENRQATNKEIKKYQKYQSKFVNNIGRYFTANGKTIDPQEIPFFINDTTIIKGTTIYFPKSKKIEREEIYFYLTKAKKLDNMRGYKASEQETANFLHSYCNINLPLSLSLKKGNGMDTVIIPIGSEPIFNFSFFENKKILVDYSYTAKNVKFKTDGYTIGYFSGGPNPENLINTIFVRASTVNKINNRINELLKDKFAIIDKQGNVTQDLQLKSIAYNYADGSIKINYNQDGQLIIPCYEYKNPNEQKTEYYFNAPLYNSQCYSGANKDFQNLKVPKDYKEDPKLKAELIKALKSSPMWSDYEIIQLFLTEKSEWKMWQREYDIFVRSRIMLADAYIKNKSNSKCLLAKEIWFEQKNDPIKGFIYEIQISSQPQDFIPYPCDLK